MRVVLFCLLMLIGFEAYGEDTIMECIDRGRIALDIARAYQEGYKPEQINLFYPNARPGDEKLIEKWETALKAQITIALAEKGTPELAAQKITDDCAYEYGKSHSNMRKSSHEGVSKEYQYCYSYIKQLKTIFKDIKYSASMAALKDYLSSDDTHDAAEIKALTDMVVKEEFTRHPPEAENYDRSRAEALVREIIGVDVSPLEWIEGKWKACVKEQGI